MIATLAVVTLAGLATGGLVGRLVNRSRRAPPAIVPAARSGQGATPALEGAPCKLGDVVLLAHGEEAWLAGALVFRERAAQLDVAGDVDRTVSALFVAPERGTERAVYARLGPPASLDWMWPVPTEALAAGDEPPSAVLLDGERFERVRRLPLAILYLGTGAPDVGRDAVIGEYEGGGGARLLVVLGTGGRRVWRGRRLDEGMYDVLPGGASTL